MRSLVFGLFALFFVGFGFGQQSTFQGKVDFSKRIRDFQTQSPASGTLYLLTGAADVVTIDREDPFLATVEMIEGEWKSESSLISARVLLRFEGAGWTDIVLLKKPKTLSEATIYPYRRFFTAALFQGKQVVNGQEIFVFKALHIQPID